MSHELLTPLRCLVKLSQDLIYDKNTSGSNKETCKTIFSSAKILNAQINNILDNNMINNREISQNLTTFSLVEIV